MHTHWKNKFLWHNLNAHQTKGILITESCHYFSASNGCCSFRGVQVQRGQETSERLGRHEITIYHKKWQAGRLGGTCFQYAVLCKRYIWEISCQQRDTHEAPFIQLKSVWPLKKVSLPSSILFIGICCGLFISFVCVWFWNIYSHWFTYGIGFFFLLTCLPCKPAPSKRVGCVDKTWAENECILCSVTFCKDLAVPLRSQPKGQLLAVAPGAERESGLKTDKGEGLQGFSTIYSCYSNHLCKSHCMGRGAEKEGPSIITWAMGGTCNTGLMLQGLGLQLTLGAVCVYKWKDNMHMYYALLQCWTKCEARILWLSGGGHCTEAALTGQVRTTECILTRRTEV